VEAETKVPHITGMCTVCAGGDRFRPIVILKQAMSLELLAQFNNLASFASSTSGWTTSDLFAMFAIDFCAQLGLYRLSLPSTLARKPALLILADDISRLNPVASTVFRMCNVDVLILPGQTTQALHPVARVISGTLKLEFKYQVSGHVLARIHEETPPDGMEELLSVNAVRCSMVRTFLDAFHRKTIPEKAHRAFEATGFVPFNPNRARESWLSDHPPTGEFDAILVRPNPVQGRLLTDHSMTQDECESHLDEIWNEFMDGALDTGRVLTQRPGIWIVESEGESRLI
jgi:hypothetical protein